MAVTLTQTVIEAKITSVPEFVPPGFSNTIKSDKEPYQFPLTELSNHVDRNKHYGDWRDDLARDGYAIIPNVVSKEKCEKTVDKIFNWLEVKGHGFKRDDPSTHTQAHLPVNFAGGMYMGYGVSQEDFAWDLRCDPGVAGVYEHFYGIKELYSSQDAVNASFGSAVNVNIRSWPHIDQSPCRRGFFILQGFVNLLPNGAKDGGLVVLKGSSALFEEFFDHFGRTEIRTFGPPDYFGLEDEELQWFFDRGCEIVKVSAGEPGSMVVWDSRTIHYAVMPDGDRKRMAIYIGLAPAKLATDKDRRMLQKAYNENLRTTHICFGNETYVPDFKPLVRSDNNEVDPHDNGKSVNKAPLTERIKELIGMKY